MSRYGSARPARARRPGLDENFCRHFFPVAAMIFTIMPLLASKNFFDNAV